MKRRNGRLTWRGPGVLSKPVASDDVLEYDIAMSEAPKYRLVRIEAAGLKPDGTPRRNSYFVSVEVDGVVHQVGIRRESGKAHLPQALIGHPDGKDILAFASESLLETLRARIKQLRPDLGRH